MLSLKRRLRGEGVHVKKLIFLLVLGLLITSCGGTPLPSVVEPLLTREPTQEPFSSSRVRFADLPPDAVWQLREQCLSENPHSLCLPFPVDPNGAQAYVEYMEGVSDWSQLVIQGPVGLEFSVPCDGIVTWRVEELETNSNLWLRCPQISCGLTREEWEVMHQPEYWPPGTKMSEPEFWRQRPEVEPWIHKSNCFTEKEFESFVKARGGRKQYSEQFDNVEIHLGEVLFTLKTAEKPGTQDGQIVVHVTIRDPRRDLVGETYRITEADFLHDSGGRIVYVQP